MITSPAWTKAIFVREPKERFLSAYKEDAANRHDFVRHKCCDDDLDSDIDDDDYVGSSYEQKWCSSKYDDKYRTLGFVNFLTLSEHPQCRNESIWKPCSDFIDDKFLPYM